MNHFPSFSVTPGFKETEKKETVFGKKIFIHIQSTCQFPFTFFLNNIKHFSNISDFFLKETKLFVFGEMLGGSLTKQKSSTGKSLKIQYTFIQPKVDQ